MYFFSLRVNWYPISFLIRQDFWWLHKDHGGCLWFSVSVLLSNERNRVTEREQRAHPVLVSGTYTIFAYPIISSFSKLLIFFLTFGEAPPPSHIPSSLVGPPTWSACPSQLPLTSHGFKDPNKTTRRKLTEEEMLQGQNKFGAVTAGPYSRVSDEELMLLNSGARDDSWESLGQQGDQTSPS